MPPLVEPFETTDGNGDLILEPGDGFISLSVQSCCEPGEIDLSVEQAADLEAALYRWRLSQTFPNNNTEETA